VVQVHVNSVELSDLCDSVVVVVVLVFVVVAAAAAAVGVAVAVVEALVEFCDM